MAKAKALVIECKVKGKTNMGFRYEVEEMDAETLKAYDDGLGRVQKETELSEYPTDKLFKRASIKVRIKGRKGQFQDYNKKLVPQGKVLTYQIGYLELQLGINKAQLKGLQGK